MSTAIHTLTAADRRVSLIYDHDHIPEYGLDTPKETAEAVAWEQERLDDGRLTAYGVVTEERCTHCGEWAETDSIWGCVEACPPGGEDDDFTRHMYQTFIGGEL